MMAMSDLIPKPTAPGGEVLLYQTEDGRTRLEVRVQQETVWLTQQHMAELFQTTKQNVGQHLKSLFAEGELIQDSVVKDSFTTADDGKNYSTKFYNLDVIEELETVARAQPKEKEVLNGAVLAQPK
jgi:hypothetical protein